MAIKVFDRVKEVTSTAGTGIITLGGTLNSYQAFSDVFSSGDQTYYCIYNSSQYEVGRGTFHGTTLSRDQVFDSSNGNNLINISTQSEVFVGYPASGSIYKDDNDQVVLGSGGIKFTDGTTLSTASAISYTAGTGLILVGSEFNLTGVPVSILPDTVVQSGNNISLLVNDSGYITEHPSVSAASDSDNSGRTYIQDLFFDSFGHVTGVGTATETGVGTTYTAGTGLTLIGTEFNTANTGAFDVIDFTVNPTGNGSPSHQEGRVFYDSDNHALAVYNDEADITLQVGQEEYLRVRNKTGSTILNGQAVKILGSQGTHPTIELAIASGDSSAQAVGLATHDIENNSFGYVTTYGVVRDIDTSSFAEGSEVFLSESIAGGLTGVSPVAPNYKMSMGHVIRSHASVGSILIAPSTPKLGGGDVKSLGAAEISGVAFVTQESNGSAVILSSNTGMLYDSGNQVLQINTGGIRFPDNVTQTIAYTGQTADLSSYATTGYVNNASGYLQSQITTNTNQIAVNTGDIATVSGLLYNNWTVADGNGNSEAVASTNTVYFSGVGETDVTYDSATNTVSISGAGEADTLQTVTDRGSVTTNAINVSGITLESTTIDNGELNSSGDFSFKRAGSEKMRLAANSAVNVYTALYPGSDASFNLGFSTLRWANGYFDQLDQEIHTASDVGHVIKGAVSQSADLAQYQNSLGTVMASIDANGNIDTTGNITASGEINVADNDRAGNGGSVRFGNNAYLASSADSEIYLGVGSQEYLSLMTDRYSCRGTAKYAWSSNNNPGNDYDTALERVDAGIVAAIDENDDLAAFHAATGQFTQALISSGTIGVGTGAPSYDIHVVKANPTMAVEDTGVGNNLQLTTAGTNNQYPRGAMKIGNSVQGNSIVNAALWVFPDSTSQKPVTLEALTNETDSSSRKRVGIRATETQGLMFVGRSDGSDGDIPFQISTNGVSTDYRGIFIDTPSNQGKVGIGNESPDAQVHITNKASAQYGLVVDGAASQSYSLQKWRNSSGGDLALIASDGSFSTTGNISATGNLTCDDITIGSHGTINPAGSTSIQMQVAGVTYLQVRAGAVQARGASLRFTDASNNNKAHIDYLDTNIIGVRDSSDANLAAFHAATGQFTQALLSSGTVDSTGLLTAATGITLQRNTPETTTDKLYNVGGVLYFNGSGVGGGGGAVSSVANGADNRVATFSSADALNGEANLTFDGSTLAVNGAITATTKSFLIDHPTKEGMKLQYTSLEGPENGVYVRGTTCHDIINLPDYWTGLVDEDSITVQLTPVGKFQGLYVVNKNNQQITVGGVDGEYDYVVYGTRKDIDPLEVERGD